MTIFKCPKCSKRFCGPTSAGRLYRHLGDDHRMMAEPAYDLGRAVIYTDEKQESRDTKARV